ncbi:hypothetical protein [Levilactobacillus fujinensis]|uniref:DUF2334 domain-containing protein n=1 Tax=Levilactobacillus fujinensis TaxID=2486024 RepID=A0ABW1TJJ5_9LACO|nr:hypothetical protein [Levilactobacillus fujinensis]
MRKWWSGLLVILSLLGGLWGLGQTAQAATRRVLIVYDALNSKQQGQTKLDAVQRLLASAGVQTRTEQLTTYRAGQLTSRHYQGVVTLNNWPAGHLKNAAFIRDRDAFTGKQLHIGSGLDATEARQLRSKRVAVRHQQFLLKNRRDWQLLPFSENITLLKPTRGAHNFGTLTRQRASLPDHPYGTVVGKHGYLPYLEPKGLSLLVAMQTIAALFGKQRTQAPLLTITGVTPYSNLKRVRQLARQLSAADIPFALSTTSVANNTSMRAFTRFTKTLRFVEQQQGVIFLQAPVVGAANAQSGNTLEQLMVAELNQLGQRQVIPVGISAPAYWNQDQILRRYGLQRARDVLLLPNPATPTFAKQDNLGGTVKTTWYGMTWHSLQTVRNGQTQQITPALPTAVTVQLPTSAKQEAALLQQLRRANVTWYAPQKQMRSRVVSASATFGYHKGTYYLNGSPVKVRSEATGVPNYHFERKNFVALSRYFKIQGWILMTFFVITTIVLGIFLFLGRRIYRRMFMRK